jgi:hypothetical protein
MRVSIVSVPFIGVVVGWGLAPPLGYMLCITSRAKRCLKSFLIMYSAADSLVLPCSLNVAANSAAALYSAMVNMIRPFLGSEFLRNHYGINRAVASDKSIYPK